jgi:Tn3 transposase DDE domain
LIPYGPRSARATWRSRSSRRYRPFAHELLPKERWEELKASGHTRLALSDDPQVYLKQQQTEIHTHLTAIQHDLAGIPGLTLDEAGNFHLARLEPDVPEEARVLSRHLYAMLPRIDLPDLLTEVNDWTSFLGACTHLLSGESLHGSAIFPLLAAMMGTGMNLGLTKLAAASPYTYGELSWAMDWYVREDTLRHARTPGQLCAASPVQPLLGDRHAVLIGWLTRTPRRASGQCRSECCAFSSASARRHNLFACARYWPALPPAGDRPQ